VKERRRGCWVCTQLYSRGWRPYIYCVISPIRQVAVHVHDKICPPLAVRRSSFFLSFGGVQHGPKTQKKTSFFVHLRFLAHTSHASVLIMSELRIAWQLPSSVNLPPSPLAAFRSSLCSYRHARPFMIKRQNDTTSAVV
jgi:hypothetical protein